MLIVLGEMEDKGRREGRIEFFFIYFLNQFLLPTGSTGLPFEGGKSPQFI